MTLPARHSAHTAPRFGHTGISLSVCLAVIFAIYFCLTQDAYAQTSFAECVDQTQTILNLDDDEANCNRYTSQIRNMEDPGFIDLSYDASEDGQGDGMMIIGQLFGATVCTVELMAVQTFGQMWCAMAEYAKEPLAAAMMLYVVLFGMMFTIGLVQPTLKEVSLRAIKMVLVWAFAVNMDYALGIGYYFYINALKDGVEIVLNAGAEGETVTGAIYKIDELMQHVFAFNQEDTLGRIITGFTGFGTVYSNIPGGNFLGGALITQGFMVFFVFARTIITYLIAIVGIAFYLTLAPIFVSFALFQATQSFFQRWLSQVSSFVIQPIIIWAYIVLIERFIRSLFDELPNLTINMLGAMGYPEDSAECWVTASGQGDGAQSESLQNVMNNPSHSVGDFMNILGGRDLSTIGNHEIEFSIGEHTCTLFQEVRDTPVSSSHDSFTDLIDMFDQLVGPVGALILVNYATAVFLDLVPELARQLSSTTGRALKIGGNWNQNTNVGAMGGTLSVLGEQSLDHVQRSTSQLTDADRERISNNPMEAISLVLGGRMSGSGAYEGGLLGGLWNDVQRNIGWRP